MQKNLNEKTQTVGTMEKRRVVMADGKRYLIYYTFAGSEKTTDTEELKKSETQTQNSTVEEEKINV